MTYTVFQNNVGQNETLDDAPGRGGYSTIIVEKERDEAIEWWKDEFGKDPERYSRYPEYTNEKVWDISEYEDEDDVLPLCGEKVLPKGGIGVPMTRTYTWSELEGRLDVLVVNND